MSSYRTGGRLVARLLQRAMAVAGFGLFAGPALAADAAGGGQALETVIVTAQYRSQNLQQTPISITAITADMLAARSQVSVAAISAQSPNVILEPAPNNAGPALQAYIRGVGQNDFNYALEPGVGMYIDDVYYSTLTGSNFDMLDLDRIEVLRGPQGTLAGMNSIGGAIKLFSKKPDGQNGGFVEGTYGSYNRTDLRAGADFTIIPDQLFVRIAGVARQQDGYVTRYDYRCTHPSATTVPSAVISGGCKLGTEGGKSYGGLRASVRWIPVENLEINLSGDYTKDNSEGAPSTLLYVGQPNGTPGTSATSYPRWSSAPSGGVLLGTSTGSPFISYSPFGNYAQDTYSKSPYVNYSTYCDAKPVDGTAPFCVPSVNQVSSYGFSGTIDYRLTKHMSVKSITAYRHYDGMWSQDEDVSPLSDEVLLNTVWHRQVSEEVRVSGDLFDGAVNYTVGGFYFDQKSHYGGRIDLGSMEFVENDFIPADSEAAFVNVGWHITDKLELNAGTRYTTESKTFIFGRLGVPGNTYPGGIAPQVASLNNAQGKYKGDNVDYRAALQYQWTDGFMTYGSFATGFKGGGINPRPFFTDQVKPFSAEKLKAYEIGFKASLFDHRMRLNGSGFLSEYSDIQIGVNNCAAIAPAHPLPCIAPINAGDAELKGFEFETEVVPTDNLQIDASLSYLNFKYTRLSPVALGTGITTGMTTPFAPEWKYSIGAQYKIDAGAAGSLTPRLDWSYQASLYTGAVNMPFNRLPGYSVLNGRLSWIPTDSLWEISLSVTNITNKLYYLGLFDNRGSSQTTEGEPAPPREWALTIKRSF